MYPKESRQILASGGDDSVVRLWDVSTGGCLQTLQGHTASVCYRFNSSDYCDAENFRGSGVGRIGETIKSLPENIISKS